MILPLISARNSSPSIYLLVETSTRVHLSCSYRTLTWVWNRKCAELWMQTVDWGYEQLFQLLELHHYQGDSPWSVHYANSGRTPSRKCYWKQKKPTKLLSLHDRCKIFCSLKAATLSMRMRWLTFGWLDYAEVFSLGCLTNCKIHSRNWHIHVSFVVWIWSPSRATFWSMFLETFLWLHAPLSALYKVAWTTIPTCILYKQGAYKIFYTVLYIHLLSSAIQHCHI